MLNLTECRDRIDSVDNQILDLLKQRKEIADDIANYKLERDQPVSDKNREQQKLNTLMQKGSEMGLAPSLINKVFRQIMNYTVAYELCYIQDKLNNKDIKRSTSVSYLGTIGTYSHLAAHKYLECYAGKFEEYGCNSFAEIVENVECGKTEYGVLPIENSSSGSINDVLDIVQMMKARIVGELFYPIDHSLLTVNGGTLEEITDIYSHPQPVTQCSNWLNLHLPNVKIHYTSASSEAMKEVIRLNNPKIAALGSKNAAKFYSLNSLVTDIANNPNNFTRFIVIAMSPVVVPNFVDAKTSIIFTTKKYTPGSLISVLNEFSKNNINLTKLHSRPRERNARETWEEIFFADVEANLDTPVMQNIMDNLKQLTGEIKVLGCYPSNEDHD